MNRLVWGCLPIALAIVVSACGSTRRHLEHEHAGRDDKDGGKVTVLMGTAPDFLDPQEGYTTQSAEATWISYLGPVHLRAQERPARR